MSNTLERKQWTSQVREWITLAISIIALCLSAGTFWLYRNEVRENMHRADVLDTPVVSVEENENTDDPTVGLLIRNESPVIAELKKIRYFVDRKPVDNVQDVIDFGDLGDVGTYEFNDNDVLAAGGKERLISKSSKTNSKDLQHFNDFIEQHVAVEIDVCSVTTGKCKKQCSEPGWCE